MADRPAAWSRAFLVVTAGAGLLFATGVLGRPPGDVWPLLYDLVLFNLVYVGAAAVCLASARRSPSEWWAWTAMALALLLGVCGNLLSSLVVMRQDPPPFPSIADLPYLLYFVPLYVCLVGVVRARAHRFRATTWLDGLTAGLGGVAVAVAVLLGPALHVSAGNPLAVLVSLAYPLGDVLLLALLLAVAAVLASSGDRIVLVLAIGVACAFAGDVVYLNLAASGAYFRGGPVDLTWVVGIYLMAFAAHRSRPTRTALTDTSLGTRVGWRALVLPLLCNLASVTILGAGWGGDFAALARACAVGCVLTALVRTAVTFREVRAFNEVKEQARTDDLTGLANRRALFEQADVVLRTATARRAAALLLLDLDGFKEVNDTLGHHAGDRLLCEVGARLRTAVQPGDVLARLGGDEFAVLLPEANLQEAQARAGAIRERVLQPFTLEGMTLHVGVSIGVATAPVPATTMQDLLRCADIAMYAAKCGREGVRVYVPDPHGGTGDRLRTMEELRTALTEGQLEVHLQPQIRLDDGSVVGAEALVRWNHPTRGLLSPAELLPAAEQAGLLRPLTDAVLERSLAAAARWWTTRSVPVSVNLSAANVTDLDLPGKVALALARHGLPARALTLELLEDTLMADPERGRQVLGELRRLGIRTSIDDYGTGYSSLAYLRHLPADELKLDRSLTADVDTDPRAAAIVRHTVALAHDLGLILVAEGVEDPATAEVLARLGCDVAQGYAVARPMPVGDFLDWLRRTHVFTFDDARV